MTHRKISLCCQVSLLRLIVFLLLFVAAFGERNAFADLLSNDTKILASIGFAGEEDTYTFTATAGDHIELRMADTSDDRQLSPRFVLIGPTDGKVLATGVENSNQAAAVTYTATKTGTYTVVAYGYGNTTGGYNLYLSGASGDIVQGDLSGDGKLDLADVILAMKILVNKDSVNANFFDINGDDAIGMPEALYILTKF